MLISLGCKFCSFTWSFKYKGLFHSIYVCQQKNKMYLKAVHNVYSFWLSNSASSRVVLFSISGLKSNVDFTVRCSSKLNVYRREERFHNSVIQFLYLLWDFLQTVVRGILLTCTFTPLLLLYPLMCINRRLKSIWFRMLLIGIQLSGPIIIKLGQWASTRRDLFSEELCFYLAKLQRRTSPHSWYYTKKCFEYSYGSNWQNIFVDFDNNGKPIGSGCCAQVYKAWVKKDIFPSSISFIKNEECKTSDNFFLVEVLEMFGFGCFSKYSKEKASQFRSECLIPVAVKVRHPQMKRKFRQDLNILKCFASTITWLIPSMKWLSLRECVAEFSHVMESQVNFYTEAENLKKFSQNFKKSNTVKFPQVLDSLTRENILVETFEEGQNIDEFLAFGVNEKIRRDLAIKGVNAILKMVFQDNFIHGDMHPGNLLVQKRNGSKSLWNMPLIPWSEPTTLVILDCGIVATLDERGKKCLRDVFAAVANCDGERVAELFLQYSNHECSDVNKFKQEMKQIVEGALSKHVTLHQIDVSLLMNSLFSTMIQNKVKVDSSFSSVILAIMVVEGLGRSLDPSLDILERAKPFLFTRVF